MALIKGRKKSAKSKSTEEKEVEKTEVVEEEIQTTFNTDGLEILVAEGDVENVEVCSED